MEMKLPPVLNNHSILTVEELEVRHVFKSPIVISIDREPGKGTQVMCCPAHRGLHQDHSFVPLTSQYSTLPELDHHHYGH